MRKFLQQNTPSIKVLLWRPLIKLQKVDMMIGLKETMKFKLSKISNT